jgi:hypothetical protein
MSVAENVQRVRENIHQACIRAGRNPAEVTLVAVTKGVFPEQIIEAVEARIKDFGENYYQEGEAKIKSLLHLGLRWHFIGHLQKNKARKVASLFEVIHSVDNLELGLALDKIGEDLGRKITCLIEVNIGRDPRKKGFLPEEVETMVERLALPFLSVMGFMTITPIAPPEEARLYFRKLRELRDKIFTQKGVKLKWLSMGMSQDYVQAIEEGATIVRVGRAIFGERR